MQPRNDIGEIATGITWVVIWNVLVFLVCAGISYGVVSSVQVYVPAILAFWFVWIAADLTQLPYVIPLRRYFRRQRRFVAEKGVVYGTIFAAAVHWAAFFWFLRFFGVW
ncbi:MAG: hypothetical protein AAF635_08140 [Cyanobacteria bacterium P01_C01_bin.69]